MTDIYTWKPVLSYMYGPSRPSAIFKPSLETVVCMKYGRKTQKCMISGTGTYDGVYHCTLDIFTNDCSDFASRPVYYVATILTNWISFPLEMGTIEIL